MRGLGEAILRVLVTEGAMRTSELAAAVGVRDGRSVSQPVTRLKSAGLIAEGRANDRWRATDRGRTVDGLLDLISADRGGKFQPSKDVGISFVESHALNWGRIPT